jgi:hypothetical protein
MYNCDIINGLSYSATSSVCTKAIAMMMAWDYDEYDIAKIMTTLFDIKARIPRVRT